MPRKLIALALLCSAIAGCAALVSMGTKYQYQYALTKPISSTPMTFEDGRIHIAFSISDKRISFRLQNKSDTALKIIWDDATIVQFGRAMRVMHSGIKYTERDASHPPTIVPPQALITDMVLPTENVTYVEGFYSSSYSVPGEWKEVELFLMKDLNNAEIREMILKSKGTTFSLYLPIQSGNETIPYMFEFTITEVKPVGQ